MKGKKALALIAKEVKETGRYGKMTPNLDNDYAPQLIVLSKQYEDIMYLVRAEDAVIGSYVFRNDGGWKAVPKSHFDRIDYDGLREEYDEIRRIAKTVQDI